MKEIEPTIQNSDLLKQVIEIKIKQGMEERYPKAEELVEEIKCKK